MTRPLHGRQVAAVFVAGFAVVIAVNVYAAVLAKQTFGGVVVENSYVASQHYNRWLDEAARERALGWKVVPQRQPDGRVALTLTGVPAGAQITAVARHPLGRQPDQVLEFGPDQVSRQVLPAGRWTLRLTVRAGETLMRSESEVQ